MPIAFGGGSIVTSANIVDGSITNDDINAAAGIVGSKLQALSKGVNAGVIPSTGVADAHVSDTAAIALTKLAGVAAKGANSDITSLTGLTTALTEGQGGTGAINGVKHAIGALGSLYAKTFFNVQLLFLLWVGSVANDTTTTFVNWVTSSAEVIVYPGMFQVAFTGTGVETITLDYWNSIWGAGDTKKIILDWNMKLAANGTGDMSMGFTSSNGSSVYNSVFPGFVGFNQRGSTGAIYASINKNGVGLDQTDVTGAITVTNWNNYRIEYTPGTDAKFYINGVLVATKSGADLCTPDVVKNIAIGRSDTNLFKVMAPNLSVQM